MFFGEVVVFCLFFLGGKFPKAPQNLLHQRKETTLSSLKLSSSPRPQDGRLFWTIFCFFWGEEAILCYSRLFLFFLGEEAILCYFGLSFVFLGVGCYFGLFLIIFCFFCFWSGGYFRQCWTIFFSLVWRLF